MKDYRILFVYPNVWMGMLIPLSIPILSACLKKEGFTTDLFDTTFYQTEENSGDDVRVKTLQVRKFDKSVYPTKTKKDLFEDFDYKIKYFKPDLIAATVVEDTFPLLTLLLEHTRDYHIPIIVGGAYPTLAPETIISNQDIDFVCVGEGEKALVEFCKKMREGEKINAIRNIWMKDGTIIIKSPLRELEDINNLPIPDFSFFEEIRFCRPMQGIIRRMAPIEFMRGCPYNCSYCAAPSLREHYKHIGKYLRIKDIGKFIDEATKIRDTYNINYFWIEAETFLAMPKDKFKKLIKIYKNEVQIPFFISTRPETVTDESIEGLIEMGCDRVTVGIETGNEEYRKKMLFRNVSNKQIIKAFEIINKYKLPVSTDVIIGFPDETREMIFDSINLIREINCDSISVFLFSPYKGTYLREYCEKKGYFNPNDYAKDYRKFVNLKNQPLSEQALLGLHRTFNLYTRLSIEYYEKIKTAEKFNEDGNKAFNELSEIFSKQFFRG